jgi:hypothetical protein
MHERRLTAYLGAATFRSLCHFEECFVALR